MKVEDRMTQNNRLFLILGIFHNYRHNLECRDGYVEIRPANWRKVSKAHKAELKELGFQWHDHLKFGDFRLDHFELSTPDGPVFT